MQSKNILTHSDSPVESQIAELLIDLRKEFPYFAWDLNQTEWEKWKNIWKIKGKSIAALLEEYRSYLVRHNVDIRWKVEENQWREAELEAEMQWIQVLDKAERKKLINKIKELQEKKWLKKIEEDKQKVQAEIDVIDNRLLASKNNVLRREWLETSLRNLQGIIRNLESQWMSEQKIEENMTTLSEYLSNTSVNVIQEKHTKSRKKNVPLAVATLIGSWFIWWWGVKLLSEKHNPDSFKWKWNNVPSISNNLDQQNSPIKMEIITTSQKIELAKRESLQQLAQNGDVVNFSANLRSNIAKLTGKKESNIEIQESRGESDCPVFTIIVHQGEDRIFDTVSSDNIFACLDTWIAQEFNKAYKDSFKLAEIQGQNFSQKFLIRYLPELLQELSHKMSGKGFELVMKSSGLDPSSTEERIRLGYRFRENSPINAVIIPKSILNKAVTIPLTTNH